MNQNLILFRMIEGQQINQYYLEKLLGAGGFGGVFRATEVVRDTPIRRLAVKIIPDSSSEQLSELVEASNLEHNHLVRSYSAGEANLLNTSMLYLAMELAESSLEAQLQQGKLSEEVIRQVLQHTAEGLNYLHQQNQVHRDLKPGNVLRVKNCYKLSDFGLVRRLGTESYVTTANLTGTYAYVPSEAFKGVISFAWDVWSLGIMAVQMLSGKLPYETEGVSELHLINQVINAEIDLPPIPSKYQPLISGCLNPERRERWTAEQVLAFLKPRSIAKPATPSTSSNVKPSQTQTLQNYVEILPGGVTLEMIAIPGGTFMMGSPDVEGRRLEKPQHEVTVQAFYMGKYPITQAQWLTLSKALIRRNPAKYRDSLLNPVERVSWDDAKKFCSRLSQKTGKEYRLPTEAEWEYACRAGSSTTYYFGNDEKQLKEYAWFGENARCETHSVGQKIPNQWGLYDMHGNVCEWCEDNWHENYENAPIDGSAWLSGDKSKKVVRNGSWLVNPSVCRSAYRNDNSRDFRFSDLGFRVVCVVSRAT